MTNLQYFSLALLVVWSPVMGVGYRYLLIAFYMIAMGVEFLR